ncbi:hypothetical protein BGY98DRAFT_1003109 [Russula aff. rugulosa BPL654]|nr:hypothetical protein BGY98DRAFT_1003109 [Russula aff. rugulosa BPL654]
MSFIRRVGVFESCVTGFSILVSLVGFEPIHASPAGSLDISEGGTVSPRYLNCDTGRRYGVCCRFRTGILEHFPDMGNDSEGILGLATFGDRSPFF